MSEPNQAVFLSYASQDAEVARRIAEALRAAGVEVWFDQNELVGGDAWDAKIRKQIAECALFVPVISAATQARLEGYFRVEWKLAAQRTHAMAEEKTFLLPIVIDDTRDAEAKVPGEFRAVQWTRLPGGDAAEKFGERVKQLLGGGDRDASPRRPASESDERHGRLGEASLPAKTVRPWLGPAMLGAAVVVALVLWQPWREKEMPAAPFAPIATPPHKPSISPSRGPKSIVVLPFENQSEDKLAKAFFADGVHEDVITNLQLIRELSPVPRTTAMSYRDTRKTNPEIARELGVAYVLTGSVFRADQKVRITAALINARTDELVWTKRYDKNLTDQFAIMSELAQAIADELRAVLSPQEKTWVERRPTEITAAYDLFLQARFLVTRNRGYTMDQRELDEPIVLLQRALQLDPKFAVAWCELSSALIFKYRFFERTETQLALAQAALENARQLAPESPEFVHALANYYYRGVSDFPRAAEQFERLVRLQPGDSMGAHDFAALLRRQGKLTESLQWYRRAADLDPGNFNNLEDLAMFLAAFRRHDDAIAVQRQIVALKPAALQPPFLAAYWSFLAGRSPREVDDVMTGWSPVQAASPEGLELRRGWAQTHGRVVEALQVAPPSRYRDSWGSFQKLNVALCLVASGNRSTAEELLADQPKIIGEVLRLRPMDCDRWATLGQIEAVLGHRDEALRCGRKAAELLPESFDRWEGPGVAWQVAFIHAWTGDLATATAEFGRLLKSGGGWLGNVHEMKADPFYLPLRGDPRFEALLKDPRNNAPLF